MFYSEFFDKYGNMFYCLTYLLGITSFTCCAKEYISYIVTTKCSIKLIFMEEKILNKLNSIDNKVDKIYDLLLDTDSNDAESVTKNEDIQTDEKSDYKIEEDIDLLDNNECHDKEELETIETIEKSEENVFVVQNDINNYYEDFKDIKDNFDKNKQTNSITFGDIFKGW